MGWFDRKKNTPQPAPEQKASKDRQIVTRVGPQSARTMGIRYEKLAQEGYKQNIIAFRAVNILARSVARIPLRLIKGDREIEAHPILDLLARPNPRQTYAGFIENAVGSRMIAGNTYMLGVGVAGKVRELWLMRPDTVKIVSDRKSDITAFRQEIAGHKRDFMPADVLHWKTYNPLDEWYGLGALEAAALAADIHNEGSKWNLAVIQNGGAPSGVLYQEKDQEPLTDEQFSNLKTQVDEDTKGAGNVGRPLLLEGGFKWQQLGLSPRDLDWIDGKKMAATEIAMAFGVPAQMVGIQDSQTYSNMQEARGAFWQDEVIPLAQDLVNELNAWLVPQFGEGLRLELEVDDLPALEYIRASRFDRIDKSASLTVNEKRQALGYDAIGDEGDVILVSSTMVPLGEEVDDAEPEVDAYDAEAIEDDEDENS